MVIFQSHVSLPEGKISLFHHIIYIHRIIIYIYIYPKIFPLILTIPSYVYHGQKPRSSHHFFRCRAACRNPRWVWAPPNHHAVAGRPRRASRGPVWPPGRGRWDAPRDHSPRHTWDPRDRRTAGKGMAKMGGPPSWCMRAHLVLNIGVYL